MPERPICGHCGKNVCRTKGKKAGGQPRFDWKCNTCHRHRAGKLTLEQYRNSIRTTPAQRVARKKAKNRRAEMRKRPWLAYRKDSCEACGFVPEHLCQLDVDHKDGNKLNNDPDNLQTLCANCHRLKTWVNEDYLPSSNTTNEPARQIVLLH